MKLINLYIVESDVKVQELWRKWAETDDFETGIKLVTTLRRVGRRQEADEVYNRLCQSVSRNIDQYFEKRKLQKAEDDEAGW